MALASKAAVVDTGHALVIGVLGAAVYTGSRFLERVRVAWGVVAVALLSLRRERGMSLLCEVLMTRLFQFWFATVCIFRYLLLCAGLSLKICAGMC